MATTLVTHRATEATDAEVVRASWQTPDWFGVLYDRHVGALYGYACLRVGAAEAEDVVADTFLAAFSQRRGYNPARSNARPWLFGILTNKIADRGRAEKIHYRALARAWQAPVVDGLAERVADRVSAAAMRADLVVALSGLRRGDRDVLLLVAWEGFGYEEVAQALRIPVGTVRSRLNRARYKVRQALAELGSVWRGGGNV